MSLIRLEEYNRLLLKIAKLGVLTAEIKQEMLEFVGCDCEECETKTVYTVPPEPPPPPDVPGWLG